MLFANKDLKLVNTSRKPVPLSSRGRILSLLITAGILLPATAIAVLGIFETNIRNQAEPVSLNGETIQTETAESLHDEEGLGAPNLDIHALEERHLPIRYFPYIVVQGDMISSIAKTFSLNQDTLISVNEIRNSRLLRIGQQLLIPNQDGIIYTVKTTDSLMDIAEKNAIEIEALRTVNEIAKDAEPEKGIKIFLPGARLSSVEVQEINGDLFLWPVRGRLTSYYGYRRDPFTGARQFHNGIDIATAWGTPLGAAMAGRVSGTGFDPVSGNYIVITHHSGYRTFYGHLDTIRVKSGDSVRAGQRIGDVGSTGLSTGSHVHFSVYKHGRTVNPLYLLR